MLGRGDQGCRRGVIRVVVMVLRVMEGAGGRHHEDVPQPDDTDVRRTVIERPRLLLLRPGPDARGGGRHRSP